MAIMGNFDKITQTMQSLACRWHLVSWKNDTDIFSHEEKYDIVGEQDSEILCTIFLRLRILACFWHGRSKTIPD